MGVQCNPLPFSTQVLTLSLPLSARMATILNGKAVGAALRQKLAVEVQSLSQSLNKRPCLATVQVGRRPDSDTYLRLKGEAAIEAGIDVDERKLPADATTDQLRDCISELNDKKGFNGILVQLPLPAHIDTRLAVQTISPLLDVDAIHPVNIGLLNMRHGAPLFAPCTPLGIMELLRHAGVRIAGKHAVVIGRSDIVGHPIAQLLLEQDATITVCHHRTENIAQVVKQGDIVIAACGKQEMVRGDWIKPGAAVIDVGINSVPDPKRKIGYRLVGDVNFNEAVKVAGCITPVPGGVGPMTIAMLLSNVVTGFKRSENIKF